MSSTTHSGILSSPYPLTTLELPIQTFGAERPSVASNNRNLQENTGVHTLHLHGPCSIEYTVWSTQLCSTKGPTPNISKLPSRLPPHESPHSANSHRPMYKISHRSPQPPRRVISPTLLPNGHQDSHSIAHRLFTRMHPPPYS